MKSLIILKSIHHQNTRKIAEKISNILNADIVDPDKFTLKDIEKYHLIGFASGIYMWKHHQSLYDLIDRIAIQNNKKAFIFSTSGVGQMGIVLSHKILRQKLLDKKFNIIGEFTCPGWDTYGPFKIIGGLNQNRPNKIDFQKAIDFATSIKNNSSL